MRTAYGAVNTTKRRWIEEALSHCTYPLSRLDLTVTYTESASLPVALHSAYMCTTGANGGTAFTTTITPWADLSSEKPGSDGKPPHGALTGADLKLFFMESVIHELMHAIQFSLAYSDDEKTALASCFTLASPRVGQAPRVGALADFAIDAGSVTGWEDSIAEAVAEAGKDLWLPDQWRYYDNRTNWSLQKENL